MFEALLEKILLNYFGKFITGLDKNNLHLGVWRGDVLIENVNLKNDFLEILGLPMKILFSNVGKLHMIVPWNKLSSSPVVIQLEEIVIIATKIEQEDWIVDDRFYLHNKFENILNYAKKLVDNFEKQQNEQQQPHNQQQQQKGYFEKMTVKIIDNIQLTIKNIHIRFEEIGRFSFGVTLEELVGSTTNQHWEKMFIDRTDQANRLLPVLKLVELKNLRLYWNSEETIYLSENIKRNQLFLIERLRAMIKEQKSFHNLININAEFKLTQNRDDFAKPQYEIITHLEKINLSLTHTQIRQNIWVLNYILCYKQQLHQVRKPISLSNEQQSSQYKTVFVNVLKQILRNDEQNYQNYEDKDIFEEALRECSQDTHFEWIQLSVKELIKESQVEELQKSRKKKWLFFFNGKEGEKISMEEVKDIDDFIESSFENKFTDAKRPANCIKLLFQVSLKSGIIRFVKAGELINNNGNQRNEAIEFNCSNILFGFSNTWMGNKQLQFKLDRLAISVEEYILQGEINKKDGKNQQQAQVQYTYSKMILQMVDESNSFLDFVLKQEKTSLPLPERGTQKLQGILMRLNQCKWTWDLQLMKQLKNLLNLKNDIGNVKTQSDSTQFSFQQQLYNFNKMQLQQQQGKPTQYSPKSQGEIKKLVLYSNQQNYTQYDIIIEQQIFLIPFNSQKQKQSDCIAIRFKQFSLQSQIQENLIGEEGKIFKKDNKANQIKLINSIVYVINLESVYINYLESIEVLEGRGEQGILFILEDYFVNLNIEKQLISDSNNTLKQMKEINGELPDFHLQLNENILEKMCNLVKEYRQEMKQQDQTYKKIGTYSFYDKINQKKGKNGYMEKVNQSLIEGETSQQAKPIKQQSGQIQSEFKMRVMVHSINIQFNQNNELKVLEIKLRNLVIKKLVEEAKQLIQINFHSFQVIDFLHKFQYDGYKPIIQSFKYQSNDQKNINNKNFEGKNKVNDIVQEIQEDFKSDPLEEFNEKQAEYKDEILMHDKNNIFEPDIVDIKIQTIFQEDEKEKSLYNIEKSIQIRCSALYINWKPDSMFLIKDLLTLITKGEHYKFVKSEEKNVSEVLNSILKDVKYQSKQSKYTESKFTVKNDHLNYLKFEKARAAGNAGNIKLKINIKIDDLSLHFIHRNTHCGISRIDMKNIDTDIVLTDLALYVEGQVNDFVLLDMTNYPKSVNSDMNYSAVKPYPLVGKQSLSTQPFGHFYFAKYSQDQFFSKDRINKLLQLDFQHIFAVYQHQVIMRNIDFITNQLIFFLVNSDQLIMNDDLDLEQARREGRLPMETTDSQEKIIDKFFCPTFLDIRINVQDLNAYFRPWPWMEEYLVIKISSAEVFNKQVQSAERFKNGNSPIYLIQKLWCESWYILANECQIDYCNGQNCKQLSQKFKYIIDWNRLMWIPDIKLVFPQLVDKIDLGMKISSGVSSLILKVARYEYLTIVKGIIHNFAFDDQKDQLFQHNYYINKLKIPNNITYDIDVPRVDIYTISNYTAQPFIHLACQNLRFKWLRDSKLNKAIGVFAQQIQINSYNLQSEKIIEESSFLGTCNFFQLHKLKNKAKVDSDREILVSSQEASKSSEFQLNEVFYSDFLLSQEQIASFNQFRIPNFDEGQVQIKFYNFMNQANGNKEMELLFNKVMIIAQTSVAVNLLAWTLLEQSTWPVKDEYGDLNCVILQINLRESHIIIPGAYPLELFNVKQSFQQQAQFGSKPLHVLATKGDISYIFLKEKMPAHEKLQEKYKQKIINDDYLSDMGTLYVNRVIMKQLEVFRCAFEDLSQIQKFNRVPKRSLILPFSLYWTMKFELAIGPPPFYPTYFKPKHYLSVEKTVVRLSYKDYLLLADIGRIQKTEFGKIHKEPPREEDIQLNELKNRDKDKCPSNIIFDATLHGLKVYFINDVGIGCVPVLECTLEETQLVLNKDQAKTIYSSLFTLSSSFYNPGTSHWEPIIEKTAFDFDLQLNNMSQPKRKLILELNPQQTHLNINFTSEMLNILRSTVHQLVGKIKKEDTVTSQAAEPQDNNLDSSVMQYQEQIQSSQVIQKIQSNNNEILSSSLNCYGTSNPDQPFDLEICEKKNAIEQQQHFRFQTIESAQTITRSYTISANHQISNQHQQQHEDPRNPIIPQVPSNQEGDTIEYVSPYTIMNETGYNIELESVRMKNEDLNNNQVRHILPTYTCMNYQLETDIDTIFLKEKIYQKEKRKIQIKIKHPYINFNTIKNIDLDMIGSKVINLKFEDLSLSQLQQQQLQGDFGAGGGLPNQQISLVMENVPQQERKILILHSNLKIVNYTDQTLELKFMQYEQEQNQKIQRFLDLNAQLEEEEQKCNNNIDKASDTSYFCLSSGHEFYVPIDLINKFFCFRFSSIAVLGRMKMQAENTLNITHWSSLIDLKKTVRQDNNLSYEVSHSDTQFSIVKFNQKGQQENQLSIEPPLIIKNCLPTNLKFKITVANSVQQPVPRNQQVKLQQQKKPSSFPTKQQDINCNQKIDIHEGEIPKFSEIQWHTVSLKNEVYLLVKINGFEWSAQYSLMSEEDSSNTTQIIMHDHRGNSSYLDISVTDNPFGSKTYYIYCQSYIINETPYKLQYFHSGSGKKSGQQKKTYKQAKIGKEGSGSAQQQNYSIYPGQNTPNDDMEAKQFELNINHIMVLSNNSNQNNIIVSMKDNGPNYSKVMQINQIGCENFDLIVPTMQGDAKALYQMSAQMSLHNVDFGKQIYSRQIKIQPKYIIVNRCMGVLNIKQVDCENHLASVECDKRIPFFWFDSSKPKSIKVQLICKENLPGQADPKEPNETILINTNNQISNPIYNCQPSQLQLLQQKGQDIIYGWSGYLNFTESYGQNTFISFTIRQRTNKEKFKIINLELREYEHIYYVIFAECTKESDALYIIENRINGLKIQAFQSYQQSLFQKNQRNSQEYMIQVEPKQKTLFAWEDPSKEKKICVTSTFLKPELAQQYSIDTMTFNLEENDTEREYKIPSVNMIMKEFTFYVMLVQEGFTKKIKFYQEDDLKEKQKQDDVLDMQINVSFKYIGVSIIGQNEKQRRCELGYLSLKNIQLIVKQTLQLRSIYLSIGYINLDNNLAQATSFPVILTPSQYRKMKKLNRSHFSLIIEQVMNSQHIQIFKSIICNLQPTTIKLTDQFVQAFANLMRTGLKLPSNGSNNGGGEDAESIQNQSTIVSSNLIMQKYLSSNNQGGGVGVGVGALTASVTVNQPMQMGIHHKSLPINNVYSKFSSREEKDMMQLQMAAAAAPQVYEWEYLLLPDQTQITQFQEFEISPASLNISFKSTAQSNSQSFFVWNILNVVGIVLKNIDDAPLKLEGFRREDHFDTPAGILKKLMVQYRENAIKSLLKIIGSINFFGNPLGLLISLWTGFHDLFDFPMSGFVKGPIEGSIGIVRGVGSLVQHSISGLFNSVQSMTDAVATGISSLSMDEIYFISRENIKMKKAQHIFIGLAQAGQSFYLGFEKGITGTIRLPLVQGKAEGFKGALKGIIKGLVGLVLKPIGGTFDAIAKTAEGIKNTAIYFNDKPNEKRLRSPRAFYSHENYYKQYKAPDSEILRKLLTLDQGKYADVQYIDCINITKEHALLISIEYVVFFNLNKKNVFWDFQGSDLQDVEVIDKGINLQLKSGSKKLSEAKPTISVSNSIMRDCIYDKLAFLKDFYAGEC